MSAFLWFRSWHGAPMDHKYPVIAARSGVKVGIVSAVMWALLDYASQQDNRGSVEGFDTEEYAIFTGFSEQEITAVIVAMTDKVIIKDGRLTNWEKRQPKREDDSKDRVTKFRELKRNVTQGNAPAEDETFDSVSVSVSVSDSVSLSESDSSLNSELGEIFKIYEREIGMITPMIAAAIEDAQKDYPFDWFGAAFRTAADNNKRSWAYAMAILKRWKVEGFQSDTRKNGNGKHEETDAERKARIKAMVENG